MKVRGGRVGESEGGEWVKVRGGGEWVKVRGEKVGESEGGGESG